MIISISGKSGSGKDTVGKIIQDLTKEDWRIKKYSDKLKDIVCILIGCTREQWEDQKFKETPLGKEWTKWGIVRPNGTRVIDIQSSYEKAFERKETVWQDGSTIKEIQLTPRMILQLLGTECGREIIHPNIWVNSLFADYKPLPNIPFDVKWAKNSKFKEGDVFRSFDGDEYIAKYPNWIITDMRFPNDVRRTREMGGVLVRVNRVECEGRENEHTSETALDDFNEWDHVIQNNRTIEELIEQVRTILEKEGIIEEKE